LIARIWDEEHGMTIRQRLTVLPGGNLKVHDPLLPDGADAEVVVTVEAQAEKVPLGEFEPHPESRPFWERIIELGARVPPEEWAKVPKDLSVNLDHYLYGASKEEE
jgi:hypothetical protein